MKSKEITDHPFCSHFSGEKGKKRPKKHCDEMEGSKQSMGND
jgi:hypothetical protein